MTCTLVWDFGWCCPYLPLIAESLTSEPLINSLNALVSGAQRPRIFFCPGAALPSLAEPPNGEKRKNHSEKPKRGLQIWFGKA